MKTTDDFKDIMDHLCDYARDVSDSTGTYIGELINLRKPITDDDVTTPAIEEGAAQVIKYISCNENHSFIKELHLEVGKGVTYDAFKVKEDDVKEDDKEPKEGDAPKKVVTDEEKAKKQIVLVKEVLREERMKYFIVPKLGSYLAIPMIHKSCLSDTILEAAISDYLTYKQKQEDQEKAKKDFEDKIAEGIYIKQNRQKLPRMGLNIKLQTFLSMILLCFRHFHPSYKIMFSA